MEGDVPVNRCAAVDVGRVSPLSRENKFSHRATYNILKGVLERTIGFLHWLLDWFAEFQKVGLFLVPSEHDYHWYSGNIPSHNNCCHYPSKVIPWNAEVNSDDDKAHDSKS